MLGPTFRPMLAAFLFQVLRTLLGLAGVAAVVPPVGAALWPVPDGLPALFERREVGALFLNARVGLATVTALELLSVAINSTYGVRRKAVQRLCALAAVGLFVLNAGIVISLRVSWTFDVLLTVVAARYCTIGADRLAPWVDTFMP